MAYNIVKHRRGTTQEWQEVDLVPEDGEIVIEECCNGSRRCKVGDGQSSFTKLPYVDDETQRRLLDEVDVLKLELDGRIANLSDALEAKITGVEEDLHKVIEETISETAANITSEQNAKLTGLEQSFQSSLDKLSTDKSHDIELVRDEAKQALATAKNSLQADLNTLREELSDVDKNKVEDLTKLESTWVQNLDTLRNELLDADAALQASIEALETADIQLSDNTKEQFLTLHEKVRQLDSVDKSLLSSINAIDETALNRFEELRLAHENDYANIASELTKAVAEQKLADQELSDALLAHISKIYIELIDLVDDDLTILNELFSAKAELSHDIKVTEARLLSKISDNAELTSEAITDTKRSLSDEILATEQLLANQALESNRALSDNIETLRSTTNIAINSNQQSIKNIYETINTLNRAISNKFEDTAYEIAKNKAEAKFTTDTLTKQVNDLDEKLANAHDRLDIQNKRIDSIVAVSDTDTEGNLELIDIRNGYNGETYDTAGSAVRALGADLIKLRENLPNIIPKNSVDGLLYEDSLLYLTADGKPVSDPVRIIAGSGGGGGGSSSISTVRVKNNLPDNILTVAKGNPAWIDFTYTSIENDIPTGDGSYIIYIDDKRIDELFGKVQHGVAKRINIADYLTKGSNRIKVTCTDQYGSSSNLAYTITVVELSISSAFNSSTVFSKTIPFNYTPVGQVEKTVHILVDGKVAYEKELSASTSGTGMSLTIPQQSHGVHKITAYLTAKIGEADEVYSNILEYEVICVSENNNTALIASVCAIQEVNEGDLITIPYIVYDPKVIESDIELIVHSQVAGVEKEISRTALKVSRDKQLWKTRNYPTGMVVFEIRYTYTLYGEITTVSKKHTIKVNAVDVKVSAEDDGLLLYLSSKDRSNSETNPAVWAFTPDALTTGVSETVSTTFSNFNWKSNGWMTDDAGDTCLRLNGDARATIHFRPFKNDFKETGRTIEFEFLVRDVNKRDTIVIDCYDGERGFQATPDTAFLQSAGTKVSCRYKDLEKVRVSITVDPAYELSRFVSIYLNGVLSGVQRYDANTDFFNQTNSLDITLGSSFCGIDVYSIRVYNKALSIPQVLNNYIADVPSPAEKAQLFKDNQILEDGKISYERVKALGQIPIITFTGEMPKYKGDKKTPEKGNAVRMKFEDPMNPDLNFDVVLKQIDVQGTSSQFYARKNWKVKLPEARQHMPGAIPAKVFCIKVDYAEATGTHNTGTANYVETFYNRQEATLPPQKDDTRVRTTIQGFPCILFEKATEDSEPVFSSKGNFNYDKDAENAFGFTEDYDDFGVECWEFCNNTSDSVNFAGTIPENWLEDFEPRYVPESAKFDRIEELNELIKEAEDNPGSITVTNAQRQEFKTLLKSCISNFREMHDWVLSTATYKLSGGARVPITPVPLANPVTYGDTTYTEDNEEYRLTKFKYEFENYFNMHYCSIYYVFTLFALMTDQRAKNMFLTRWKDDDGVHRWYPYFYDNDTIFGINNEGAVVFDYFHEDIDQLGSANVFNGQNSVLWDNYRRCFPQEIKATYAELRNTNKLTYEAIIDQYVTRGSDMWSATIYNEDAEYKYLSMARYEHEHENTEGNTIVGVDASNLYQVRGPGEQHLKYFISNRLNYCDSKWYAGSYPSDFYFLRIYTPTTQIPLDDDYILTEEEKAKYSEEQIRIYKSLKAVPANPAISVTPYSDMYAGVKYKANGVLQQARLAAGVKRSFGPTNENETFNDTETAIYGASALSSLGDLSGLYCGVVNLVGENTGDASGKVDSSTKGNVKENKLVELIIGNPHPDYYNDNFREIAVGTCRLLRKIDLRNCSGLGIAGNNPQKTLDLTGCPNIEHIYTEGTNLNSVALPDGGYVKTLHLPASINSIVIKNQRYISDFSAESYENIRTLRLENCSLNADQLLANCRDADGNYTVKLVRITDLDWHFENTDFIKSLFTQKDDSENIIGGIQGIDANNNPTEEAYLTGTCYIEKLTGADYAEIKKRYNYLKLEFGEMTSNIIFMDVDGKTELYRESIVGINSDTPDCLDPVLVTNKIEMPVKESTAEFDYEWSGWTTNPEEFPTGQKDALDNVAGDRVLYPAFKAIRRSYPITFINPTAPEDKDKLLAVVSTLYGNDAIYSGSTPVKHDAQSPNLYTFIGWYPSPEKITGEMTCYAQFAILDDKWYTLTVIDISDYEDYNHNVSDGYRLNESTHTMAITGVSNKQNIAVKVPRQFSFENGNFTVVDLGGFQNHDKLELVDIPDSVTSITARAFASCTRLFELTLPSNLRDIGESAFQGCSKLKELYIPASVTNISELATFADCTGLQLIEVDKNNPKYEVVQDCLIDKVNGILLKGLSTGIIPQDGSIKSFGTYSFSMTDITSATVPEGITTIAANVFSRCNYLAEVALPSSLITLDATCFAWCKNLKEIELPDGLINIKTYVFDACALEHITIPASVENILERAFGDMESLKTVTFKKCLDENGNVKAPFIQKNAFAGCKNVVFNVPWSEDYDYDYYEIVDKEQIKRDPTGWGSENYTINYNYEEVI